MAIWRTTLLIAALLFGAAGPAAAQGRRVALVIGNGLYRSADHLANPANDAKLMASTLSALGFTLIGGHAQVDLDKAAFDAAVRAFGESLPGAEVALFYYAGHGMQVAGENWLVPVNANPTREQDLDFQMVNAALVLKQMQGAGTKLNVMILDACRNNPFAGRGFRGGERGLARMNQPDSTVISYATQPGAVARDGEGADSPYTLALAQEIRQPGLDVLRMFNRVGLAVRRATGGDQLPWVSNSPIDDDYFLAGPGTVSPPAVTPPPAVAMITPPPAPAPTPPAPAVPSGVIRDCPDCPELVRIPAGSFSMGVPAGEEEREGLPDDFKGRSVPVHPVTISQPFLLGRTHVTRRQYAVFARATHRAGGGCWTWDGKAYTRSDARSWESPGFAQTDDDPAVCLSFDDAQAYVAWLSARTGQKYRLPSEAEWEYAARANTSTSRYWGDTADGQCGNANGADQSSKAKVPGAANWTVASCDDGFPYTSPAGHFRPNLFGVYDMLGNAFQWTSDCWNATYAGAPANGSSWGTGDCASRVVRGGSWDDDPGVLRAGYRGWLVSGNRYDDVGVRVARTLTP